MMTWWLDLGVDGFRLDVINRLKKPAGLPDSKMPPTPPVGIYGYVVDRAICTNVAGIQRSTTRQTGDPAILFSNSTRR